MNGDRIRIFDTTMRDGEQADHPMSIKTKVKLAIKLEALGVDIIEAGFPVSSQGEIDAIRKISTAVSNLTVCALARVKQGDIEAAAKSLELANKPRIHVFASTSDIHIKHKLQSTRDQVLVWTGQEVERAKRYCSDVEFSAEDATRTDRDYLIDIVRVAVAAGATTINLPDTVGYSQPDEYGEMIEEISEEFPNVIVSVHCHNDLGLAVANSLSGVLNGANQVEGCFLGIGERAGNADLEQVIVALHTRSDFYNGLKTNIKLPELGPYLRFLSDEIGYPISDHNPIVGKLAFAHSSGIHVDGVLKHRQTYEIIKPADIGWTGSGVSLVSHLGESGLSDYLLRLGYNKEGLAAQIMEEFKLLANKLGRLNDEDLHMLVQEHLSKQEMTKEDLFVFGQESISFSGDGSSNEGKVLILKNSRIGKATASGEGPVDAVCNAIDKALLDLGEDILSKKEVRFHFIHGSGGSEALGFVRAKVQVGNRIGYGRGSSHNIVEAYAIAYLDAINHLVNVPISEEREALRKVFIG